MEPMIASTSCFIRHSNHHEQYSKFHIFEAFQFKKAFDTQKLEAILNPHGSLVLANM